jgi:hypothetical protein
MLNFEHQDLGVNRQKIGYQNVRYLGPVKVDYVISNLITILAKSLGRVDEFDQAEGCGEGND